MNGAEPMRILHVVPTYLPATRYGGPIYSVHGLCKALAALGHDVQVFTTNVDGPGDSAVPLGMPVLLDGVRVTYFPSKRFRRLYWSPPMARALAREMPNISVLHLHSVFLWPTQVAAREARLAAVPYLVAPRGALVPELVRRKSRIVKTTWLRFIESRTLAGATRLHVTSEAEYRDAERLGLRLPPACVVPNGVDVPDLAQAPPLRESLRRATAAGPYVLVLGRISWKKGFDRLFAAMEGTPLRVLIAGPDDEGLSPALDRLIDRHRISAQVEFVGPVDGTEKWELIRQARALAMPSYNENFGNSVVEAMAMGCPVVVSAEVGIAGIVEGAECGLVTRGGAVPLRDALTRLWADSSLCARMGTAGKRYVQAHFRWETIARAMEGCYRELRV